MMLVAGYCRVSTDKEDQANSFAAQKDFFKNYIGKQSGWQLYDIYADEGITGTTTCKRTQFNRMLNEAREGKFQMILTKEISRFSRNILDTIRFTRELKEIGVGVVFLTENLNTLNPETEMLLAFMGTMAQEESRRTSVRVKWGQARSMEKGVVFGNCLFGYDVNGGKLAVIPEEAEIVRRVYHMYGVEKRSTTQILRELQEKVHYVGINWTANRVIRMLKNEKYSGDLIQKKTITPDYLSHKKKPNRGEEEMIILRNHHEPIVSRELWDIVQKEMKARQKRHSMKRDALSRSFALSGKICCGECGATFLARHKGKNENQILVWRCGTAVRQGVQFCDVGKLLREDDAEEILHHLFSVLQRELKDEMMDIAERVFRIKAGMQRKVREKCCQRLSNTKKKKTLLLEALLTEKVTQQEFEQMRIRYDNEENMLKEKYLSLCNDEDRGNLSDAVGALTENFELYDVFCRELVERITVHKDSFVEIKLVGIKDSFKYHEGKRLSNE